MHIRSLHDRFASRGWIDNGTRISRAHAPHHLQHEAPKFKAFRLTRSHHPRFTHDKVVVRHLGSPFAPPTCRSIWRIQRAMLPSRQSSHQCPRRSRSESLCKFTANVRYEYDDLKVTLQKMGDQHILRGTWMINFRTKLPTRQAFSTDGTLREIYYDVLRLSSRHFSDSFVPIVRLNMPQNVLVSQSDHKARALEAAKSV